jgi:MscS family membrane protein
MRRLWIAVLLAGTLHAQAPASTPVPAAPDPLGRDTPQHAVFEFLEACHAHNYAKAAYYLDLRKLPAATRSKDGQNLARQLEDLLDDSSFDITNLSRSPEGDLSDGLSPIDHLATFTVDGQMIELQLERIQPQPGLQIWQVSAASVALIPKAHLSLAESPFEKKLPQALVTFEVLDTPVWRWIALLLMALGLWIAADLLARALALLLRRAVDTAGLRVPFRLIVWVVAFRAALELAPPATLARTVIERGLGMIFAIALAWAGSVLIDFAYERWRTRLDPRLQAVGFSVLPLGRQVLRLSLFLFAILSVLNAWGYNTTAILAGVGVGGIAIALAAQKTIEDLFGGISVIGDRPVLVGDACKFDSGTGTVMHIGLRSTRIRTPDRTVISVPNGKFASMTIENLSGRDKIWFHPKLNLRRDTTSEQLLKVLDSVREILSGHPKVETGQVPVRFTGVGTYSLDVEVAVYITTANDDEFLEVQQELLLRFLRAVEDAGTRLAMPFEERSSTPLSK